MWAATRQGGPCHKKEGGALGKVLVRWPPVTRSMARAPVYPFTSHKPDVFVMELLAFNKLSYCKTADILPSQAFSVSDPSYFAFRTIQMGIFFFFSVVTTKPISLNLVIQVRTTRVCTRRPICCFRNLKSKALVLPFRKILLSCSDLWCP